MASEATTDTPKTSLLEDLRELGKSKRELWLIYFATFLEYLGIFSFLQTLPLWLSSDHGMDDKQAGWWAATFSTLITLFLFLAGAIADFIGVRTMLLLSFSLAAITRLGMSLSSTPTMAIATLIAFSVAYGMTSPVLQAAIHFSSNKRTRAFAFSLWYVSFNLSGTLVGPMIDYVRHQFLDPASPPGKEKLIAKAVNLPILGERMMTAHAMIMGIGFLFAAAAVVIILFVRKGFEKIGEVDEGPKKKPNPLTSLKEVFSDKFFWRFLVLIGLLSLVRMMFQHMHFTWPKYITRVQGETFPVGTVWSFNSFLILFLAPLGTALTRNRPAFEVLLFGAFISALCPFILMFGSSMPYQIAMIIVLTIGEALWSPRLYEYNVSIAPPGKEATYVSLAAFPYFMAKFLVGPTSGYLLSAYCPAEGPRTPATLWAIIGVSTILGPIGIWLLRGWIQRKEPTVAAAAA